MICESQTRATAAFLGNPPASDVSAGRPARRRRVSIRRLARGRRAVVVAGAAARAAGRSRLAVPLGLGLCGLAAAARRAGRSRCRSASSRTSWRATRTGRAGGRASQAQGALADQVRFEREWTALRDYARVRGVRLIGDVPIYVSDDRRRRRSVARALRPRRGRRGAAGRAERERAALGESALRLARAPRDRLSLVDRALPSRVRARRSDEGRPLPRVRLVLGDPGAPNDGTKRQVAARPGRRALPHGRARPRRAAGDRGGPRRDHPRRSPGARRAPPARHGGAPLGVPRTSGRIRTRHATTVCNQVVYTSTHDTDTVVGWFESLRQNGAGGHRPRSERAAVGADRARDAVARRARDRSRAGRPRARQRGAHEPARRDRRQLVVAARARSR